MSESTNKFKQLKECVKSFAAKVINYADALYNKLPLDTINAKLNHKVDVASRKFKMAFSAVVAIVFLLLLSTCFITSSNKALIIPKLAYFYSPEHVEFELALIDAGLRPAWYAFFKAVPQASHNTFAGLDARSVCTKEYVSSQFGEEAVKKFEEVLKSQSKEEWKDYAEKRKIVVTDMAREVEFILDNIVDTANKEIARRRIVHTIKAVKTIKKDTEMDSNGMPPMWEDYWDGEFIAIDEQGRKFDKVFFSCAVSFDQNKTNRSDKKYCGDAPLKFSLIWFGTSFTNDNWMSTDY